MLGVRQDGELLADTIHCGGRKADARIDRIRSDDLLCCAGHALNYLMARGLLTAVLES